MALLVLDPLVAQERGTLVAVIPRPPKVLRRKFGELN